MVLLLDEKIRDYVLLPIFIVVASTSVLRTNLMAILKSDTKADMKEVRSNNLLGRSRMLRMSGNYLSDKAFKIRKAFFIKKDVGLLHKPPEQKNMMDQMAAGNAGPDPTAAMGMMKSQMVFIVIQGGLSYWVSHLFSGFLVAKLPFPLTFQFKGMLQRGVDVSSLETGYVSSLCFYFFVMMSSHAMVSFFTWFKDKGNVDNEDDPMAAMMGTMGGGMMPGGGPDMGKIYKQEADSLEIFPHEFRLENIETDLWRKWRKDRPAAGKKR